jgi:hypothetical protein
MRAEKQTLRDTLGGQNRYIIPVFQRYYSWKDHNWQQLWDDLLAMADPQARHKHFMGTLVFVPEDHVSYRLPAYHVIDGQQRLVTLSLLLCALRNAAAEKGHSSLASEIENTYLVHQFKSSEEHFRIYPRQRDRGDYLAAVTGEKPVSGNIGSALVFFSSRLSKVCDDFSDENIRGFFSLLISGIEFVHISLEEDNPYKIFRSLNSTGIDLSEADLIRNFVFMHIKIDEQDAFDDTWWKPLEDHFEGADGNLDVKLLSGFFRDYLMRNGQYVGPAATFETFERTYQQSFKAMEVVTDLKEHVNSYDIIRGVRSHSDQGVESALTKLRQLDSSTTYPLLLKLMEGVRKGEVNNPDLAESVELLAGFILRRFACGESSRAYGRWFVAACKELGETPLKNLESFLVSKGFPSDGKFTEQFTHLNVYGSNYCRSILEYLERSQPYDGDGKPHKEQVDLSTAQIEHIMPQTLSDEWKNELGPEADRIYATSLDTIGNLTLSGYNPELHNHPFAEKRVEYEKSKISLTRELAKSGNWTEPQMVQRGQRLAEMASHIWTGPENEGAFEEDADAEEPRKDRNAERISREDWEGKANPESLAIVDSISQLTPTTNGKPDLTYNKGHIALASGGHNFCWFHPRGLAHCAMRIKPGAENRQRIISQLENAGIEAHSAGRNSIRLHLSMKDITQNRDLVAEVLRVAEKWSHR